MGNAQQRSSCDRNTERYVVSHAEDSWISFRDAEGETWQLPLLEISASGLKFGLDGGPAQLPEGLTLHDVTVRVDETEFRCDLCVSHVTASISTGAVCGAGFRCRTGPDQFALVELIERLAAR